MIVDIMNIAQIALTVIGAASVVLSIVAPLTKSSTDDKILYWIKKILSITSINVEDKTLGIRTRELEIKIKQK